jgi:hypothetical protein
MARWWSWLLRDKLLIAIDDTRLAKAKILLENHLNLRSDIGVLDKYAPE